VPNLLDRDKIKSRNAAAAQRQVDLIRKRIDVEKSKYVSINVVTGLLIRANNNVFCVQSPSRRHGSAAQIPRSRREVQSVD
jgi:hypothetical protein